MRTPTSRSEVTPGRVGCWWRREVPTQDQVGGDEVVGFICCCCSLRGEGRREEEEEEKEGYSTSPPAVVAPAIPTPRSREVESEEEEEDKAMEESPVAGNHPVRRSKSTAAKRQWELVEKTSADALHRGLKVQRTAAAAQAKMPAAIRPKFFKLKPRVPAVTR
jgi:hypothetical protein